MGKTLGIIALIVGIIGLIVSIIDVYLAYIFIILSPFIYPPIALLTILGIIPILSLIVAIVCGAIGIKKDDSPGLAIAGLVIGSSIAIVIIIFMLLSFGPSSFTPF
ncbi:MAG: hypothetical protein WBH31_18405 [Promethearchaeia archaeon]